jgi:hypothetical protein
MNYKYICRNLSLFFVLFLLSLILVQAFEVKTLNGETMDWKESFCLEDPDNYYDLVGEDYYAYCEYDFAKEYYADGQEEINITSIEDNQNYLEEENEIENVSQELISENIISEKDLQNQTEEEINNDETQENNVQNDNWQLFLGIIGIVLLFTIITLIVAHNLVKKRDNKNQIISLSPYINNLRKRGYSENQLEEILIKKGYDSAFIRALLNKH